MPQYTVGAAPVRVDRPQAVIDQSPLYQLTQFARRQAGLTPLVGSDAGGRLDVVVGDGPPIPEPRVLPMWLADP